jgi:hypothetical protein
MARKLKWFNPFVAARPRSDPNNPILYVAIAYQPTDKRHGSVFVGTGPGKRDGFRSAISGRIAERLWDLQQVCIRKGITTDTQEDA